MLPLPIKLKKDAIAEAICEIRFDSAESKEVPELVVGRLADHDKWHSFRKNRLPVSDIPAPIRQQDPTLRNQPMLELRDDAAAQLVKIGSNVISFHQLAPYPGWELFKPELHEVLDLVHAVLDAFRVVRLGFRYVNLLNETDHKISDITALNYSIDVAGAPLKPPLNLNYQSSYGEHHTALVRIASPEFVSGNVADPFSALVDIDVFTPSDFSADGADVAKAWVERAHEVEKTEFFKLFTPEILEELVEE